MRKQDAYIKQKKLQAELDKVGKFIPNVVVKEKNGIMEVSKSYTITHDGGDRFGLYLEKILQQERNYLINKVKIMSAKDLEAERVGAVAEADEFSDENKKS